MQTAAAMLPEFAAAPVPFAPLDPMLASAMTGRRTFEDYLPGGVFGFGYVLEPKLDGYRLIVHKRGGEILAHSRAGNLRPLPAAVVAAIRLLPDGIYDGELLAPSGKSWGVTVGENFDRLQLVLFDVVEVLGVAIAGQPYTERRAALTLAIAHVGDSAHLMIVPSVPVSHEALAAIYAAGGEGAMLKRTTSIYYPGYRTAEWIKVVPKRRATVTVTGFKAGSFGPHATILVRADDGTVTKVKTKNHALLRAIALDPASYIGRRLVISYRERTPSGSFRHPMFDHWAGEGE